MAPPLEEPMDDEQGDLEAVETTEQDTVTFYGHPIVTVTLADGRHGVVLRWICEGMEVDTKAQVRRIKRTLAIKESLVTARVNTEGGRQAMPTLLMHAVPFWLTTVDESRMPAGEKRENLTRFKIECAEILYTHFAEKAAVARAIIPAEQIVAPTRPSNDAAHTAWISYYQEMITWHQWQQDMETFRTQAQTDITDLQHRMIAQEDLTRSIPEIVAHYRTRTLSDEHQATVVSSVKRLSELTGRTISAIYEELKFAFRVSKYDRIPEARWQEVAHWLIKRIHKAGGKTDDLSNEQQSLFE